MLLNIGLYGPPSDGVEALDTLLSAYGAMSSSMMVFLGASMFGVSGSTSSLGS